MMTSPGVEIMPIENFSTEHILGLNLKESLETIQKIGESAAKEYQIEQGNIFNIYIYMKNFHGVSYLNHSSQHWTRWNANGSI